MPVRSIVVLWIALLAPGFGSAPAFANEVGVIQAEDSSFSLIIDGDAAQTLFDTIATDHHDRQHGVYIFCQRSFVRATQSFAVHCRIDFDSRGHVRRPRAIIPKQYPRYLGFSSSWDDSLSSNPRTTLYIAQDAGQHLFEILAAAEGIYDPGNGHHRVAGGRGMNVYHFLNTGTWWTMFRIDSYGYLYWVEPTIAGAGNGG